MPRLNKCIHRETRQGFTRSYRRNGKWCTHFSGRIWHRCKLVKMDEDATLNKLKCKGRNCGKYKEADKKCTKPE